MGNMNAPKRTFASKGFYIALALCLVVTGVIGYAAFFRPEKSAQDASSSTTVVEQPAPKPAPKPVEKAQVPPAPAPEPPQKVEETMQVEDLIPQVVSPLDGTTVTVFSMTELLYDETMADWRTHNGMDIQAAEGDAVKTAADGKVVKVEDDELMGTTVYIEHEDGYTTQYSSLLADPPVAEGQAVSAGDIIGYVGDTASAESNMGPHLHFSVTKDGKVVDPNEYVK